MGNHTESRQQLMSERLRAARARLASGAASPPDATTGAVTVPDGIPARGDGRVILSYEQQRIWLVDRIFGESRDYNVPQCMAIEGDFDESCFETALTALTTRHEILRTIFPQVGGQPQPVVRAPGPVPITVADLRHLGKTTDPAVFARMVEHAATEADRPFRLEMEPPFRAAVLRCGERHRLVLLTVHHIATDGPSTELMWRELTAHYADAVQGLTPRSEPPALQYADFAAWERRRHAERAPKIATSLAYWAGRLADLPDDCLPTDLPRPQAGSRSGAEIAFTVPAEVSRRLREIAAECRATPYMALLAGFKALLAVSGGQTDIVVGTPVAGRDRDELDRTIGPYLNVLPMRTDLRGTPSFAELICRVRETALGAYAHQEVPFARLVEHLRPERSLGKNPLFQVLFTHQQRKPGTPGIPGATVRPVQLPVTRSKFDLSVTLTEEEGSQELSGSMVYATDLFEPDTARRLAERFVQLLRAASERPETELARLQLHDPDELKTLVHQWGRGEPRDIGSTLLPSRVVTQAARTPDAAAVTCGDTVLTYAELEERSARLAQGLRRRGLSAEEPIGVCLQRSPDLVVALLAVLRAGGSYVPIDPDLAVGRIQHVLQDSGARLVLAHRATLAAVAWRDLEVDVVDLDEALATAEKPGVWLPPDHSTDPDQLAYTIYTSGSTGRPKGVMVSHQALANFAADMVDRLSLDAADVVAALTTVSFDIAVLELLVPLTAGARVEIFSRTEATDGARLGELLGTRGVTVVQATPAGWALLVSAGWSGGNVRAVCGGETLPGGLAAEIRSRTTDLWNVYGPTETTVWSTAHRVSTESAVGNGPSLGQPLANTSVYVLDARLSPVPIGAAGELYIGGKGLARGYVGQPGLTAERFLPDPFADPDRAAGARMYATGDLVRYRHSGKLEFLGRRDHQVKVRGHRIELGEIEARLIELPGVAHAVVAVSGEGADRFLVGYVVRQGQASDAPGDLMAHLRRSLPTYMIPQRMIELDRLPLTSNGKVDRKALPNPGPPSSGVGYVPPATELEHAVAQAWADVLGVERVGAHDDFFALGGHSLRATQLVALLRERLSLEASVQLVFEAPTIRAFASALGTEHAAAQVPANTEDGPAPLSFSQQRLWFLDRLRPGRTDYNVPSTVRLTGPLHQGLLERAMATVLERHEVLRSCFVSKPDGPVLGIAPLSADWLAFADISTLAPTAAEREAIRQVQEDLGRPFDLAHGPMFRARLVRISDHDHLLAVVMHHAVVDGWSLRLFWQEVSEAYRGVAADTAPQLPTLPVQYADFSVWERHQDTAADLAYWRTRLEGSTVTEIPADRARPAEFDESGATVTFEIPEKLQRRLSELGRELGATPFVVLLTAFMATLSRLSGQPDVVVGSPVAGSGRQRPEFARLIGPFLNTVVLRADLSAERSFATCVADVREAVLGASAHQDLPFEHVVQALEPDRHLGKHPLFQIMFAVDEDESRVLSLPGIAAESVPLAQQGAKFDLSLVLREREGGMTGSLVFATALYEPETVRGITDLYLSLLTEAAARPHAPLSWMRLLDTAAAARLAPVQECSPDSGCVHELFEARAAEQPDAVAVEQAGEAMTYGQLNQHADRLARSLRDQGLGPGHFVGVALPRSFDLVVALLAVLKSGAAYVPVDPGQPKGRNGVLLTQAGVSAVLAPGTPTNMPMEDDVRVLDVSLQKEGPARRTQEPAGRAVSADLAYVTFTSGSTGKPKAVPATHASVSGYLREIADAYRLGTSDIVLQLAAVSFDAAARDILGTLTAGARLVLMPQETAKDPRAIVREIHQRKVTALLSTVPSLLTALAAVSDAGANPCQDSDAQPWPLRLVLVSGEELTPEAARRACALSPGVRLVNLYGPTECTMTSTSHRVTQADIETGRIPIGVPTPGTRAVVLGPGGEPLPTGAMGELCLGGATVSLGYLGDPALTAQCFVPDPYNPSGGRLYRTGDLVRFDHRGRLFFHGRLDHQVKVRGVRIEPGEVEVALLAEPGVREAAAVVSDPGGELVAWMVAEESVDLRQLRSAIADRLPEQMRPTHYMRCAELPRTPHGKLDRRALARRLATPAPAQDLLPPRNQTELRLLGIWEEVLGLSPLGVRQDFFEAGGHSLKAVDLMEEVRRRLGIELPLHVLFRHPTVEGLAAAITAAAEKNPTTRNRLVVPLNDAGGDLPPLFLVHPQSGDVCCYMHLVRELGNRRPIYGIEAVGYSTDDTPLSNIEAMAARYVEEARAVAPRGPYLLAGWSFGGSVALEMAAALEAAGEEVTFLGLIDARAFGEDELEEWYVRNTELVRFGIAHGISEKELPTDDDEAVLATVTRHLSDTYRTTDYADSGMVRRMIDVFTANGRAADDYRPQTVVSAPLHVFKATERHPTLSNPPVRPESWRPRTSGGIHVIELPGNHHDLASPPHVKVFAERLRRAMDQPNAADPGCAGHDQPPDTKQKGSQL